MEAHASRDLMAERLHSRRLADEIESIITGAYNDNSTITGLRLTMQDLQQQVQQLQAALEQQREHALRHEQQLVSDYKRSLKLDASGNPRCDSQGFSSFTMCTLEMQNVAFTMRFARTSRFLRALAGMCNRPACSARAWSSSGCLLTPASFKTYKRLHPQLRDRALKTARVAERESLLRAASGCGLSRTTVCLVGCSVPEWRLFVRSSKF